MQSYVLTVNETTKVAGVTQKIVCHSMNRNDISKRTYRSFGFQDYALYKKIKTRFECLQ